MASSPMPWNAQPEAPWSIELPGSAWRRKPSWIAASASASAPSASPARALSTARVAESVAKEWNTAGNCMLVVGATYPEELADIRQRVGDLPFLVPGVGAQGGDVAKVMAAGKTAAGTGLVISSSRAILYASSGDNFAAAARKAAQELRDSINAHR